MSDDNDRKTILLVEDEPIIRLAQARTLKDAGYEVITASSGEKAVETVKAGHPIDIILMDINLGKGMDGTQAAEIISRDHDIPLLFLSCHTQKDIVEKTEKITSYGYVVKDSGITVLNASIRMAFKLHTALRQLKEKEKAIEESEEYFRSLIENSADIIMVYDADGTMRYQSPSVGRIVGYTPEETIGRKRGSVIALHPDDQATLANAVEKAKLAPGVSVGPVEVRVLHKDGSWRWSEAVYKAVVEKSGRMILVVNARDIGDRKEAEERIKSSLKEKETLLREIHHRVKNSLQVISSILSIQSGFVTDEKTKEVLRECQRRVQTIAMIHDQFHQSKGLARIDAQKYLRDLAYAAFGLYHVDTDNVALHVTSGDVSLDINAAIPLGLILNELISNAVKHAFPKSMKGNITIDLSRSDDRIVLTVSDNGIGFPENIDYTNTESLGLQLVVALVEQLEGTVDLNRRRGTQFRVAFKE